MKNTLYVVCIRIGKQAGPVTPDGAEGPELESLFKADRLAKLWIPEADEVWIESKTVVARYPGTRNTGNRNPTPLEERDGKSEEEGRSRTDC